MWKWTTTPVIDKESLRSSIREIVREEIVFEEGRREMTARTKERHEKTGGTIQTGRNSYGSSHVYVSGCPSSSGDPEYDRVVIGVQSSAPKGEVWSPTSLTLPQVDELIAALERARKHISETRKTSE